MEATIKKVVFNRKGDRLEQVNARIPETMLSALQILADLQNMSVPDVIRDALEAYLIEVVKKYPDEFKKLKLPKI